MNSDVNLKYLFWWQDFEFIVYNNSKKNVYVKNGELVIKPTILSDDFVKNGHLILNGYVINF